MAVQQADEVELILPAYDPRGVARIGGKLYRFTVTRNGFVFEAETGGAYSVLVRGRAIACDCPDSRYRRRRCKHQRAADLLETMPCP
jgi:hypothetical protein